MKGQPMKIVIKRLAVLALVVGFLAAPVPAFAGLLYNKDDSNGTKIMKKLGRGLLNSVTCWMELPLAWVDYADQRDPFTAVVFGTADGIVKSVDRAAGGVYETVFFAVPSPRYYKPVLDPETLFDD
jgi:putative exosortase-associated protein (TIGR04073 family)